MTETLQSKGIVRRIVERNGETLVSFPNHDGYFHVAGEIKQKVLAAHALGREITFTYDHALNIVEVVK